MDGEKKVTLRFPDEIHDRAQAVADVLATKPNVRGLARISKAYAFRAAVLRGLEDLEREHGLAKKRKK